MQRTQANFFRRLASFIYDALVVIAFTMLATVLYLLIIQCIITIGWLQLGDHEDIAELVNHSALLYSIRAILLISVSLLFFSYFWTKSGQTIGMRAWRLKVQNPDGSLLSWPKATLRSITALLGLGNILVLLDFKTKRSLQDIICNTEVIVLTKEENKAIYNSLD
jgi:uncharacterized RDD family membrane protein YckC